jgi:hypothetical protein
MFLIVKAFLCIEVDIAKFVLGEGDDDINLSSCKGFESGRSWNVLRYKPGSGVE